MFFVGRLILRELHFIYKNKLYMFLKRFASFGTTHVIHCIITNFACLSGNKLTNWCPSSRRVFKSIKVIYHCSWALHLERNISFKESIHNCNCGFPWFIILNCMIFNLECIICIRNYKDIIHIKFDYKIILQCIFNFIYSWLLALSECLFTLGICMCWNHVIL
jgi:hypothetical protein